MKVGDCVKFIEPRSSRSSGSKVYYARVLAVSYEPMTRYMLAWGPERHNNGAYVSPSDYRGTFTVMTEAEVVEAVLAGQF